MSSLQQAISFLSGTGMLIALAVFVLGCLFHVVRYIGGLDAKKDRVAYGYHADRSVPGIFASIFKWLLPGATAGWRSAPLTTFVFFCMHAGCVLVPLFVAGHVVLLKSALGIEAGLPMLPLAVADVLAAVTIAGVLVCAVRRLVSPFQKALTSGADWLILFLTGAPFVSGFLVRVCCPDSAELMLVHLVCGNLFLLLAPFTKLSHIVLFFMSRAQLGMEYAIKRGGQTRGGVFDW